MLGERVGSFVAKEFIIKAEDSIANHVARVVYDPDVPLPFKEILSNRDNQIFMVTFRARQLSRKR